MSVSNSLCLCTPHAIAWGLQTCLKCKGLQSLMTRVIPTPNQSVDENNENKREPIESRHVYLISFVCISTYWTISEIQGAILLPHAMPAFQILAFHQMCPETLVVTQSIQNWTLRRFYCWNLESLALGGLRGIQSSHTLELRDNSRHLLQCGI